MEKQLDVFASLSGGLGILVALLAGVSRLLGHRFVFNFEAISLLIGSVALMAMSCVVQLYLLRKGSARF